MTAARFGSGPVASRWQRIEDYLKENGIHASFGIICESLEADNPAYFQWIKDIKIWLYGPKTPKHFTRLSLDRVLALENPAFVPDPVKFRETYEKSASTREVLVPQGPPNQWDDQRWAGFLEIIGFLKSKHVAFMPPSHYLAKTSR